MLIRILYTSILYLTLPFFLYSLYKSKPNKPKFGKRCVEHFGFTPKLAKKSENLIWIHAVSVGEVLAITPLIKSIKKLEPELKIVLTTTTSTGKNEAQKLGKLIEHRYMPLDLTFAVKNFIKAINPTALFIMETELWPNTLHACKKNNISVTIINARLSERSATRYKKFPFIYELLLKNISMVLAQTQLDANRFVNLGLPPEKVKVTGSIKFDINVTKEQLSEAATLRNFIGQDRKVWIAASTHKGEDEKLIQAHKKLLSFIPDALMILVPRHPERFVGVKELAKKSGLSVVTRSSKEAVDNNIQLYLGDSMGEMMILLGAADICFIAGSLVGDKVGGHNLLEAAALEKPILNGPSYFNFKEITEQLVSLGACKICGNSDDISASLEHLFKNKRLRKEQGNIALKFVQKNQGSLQKTAIEIQNIIHDNKL